MRYLNSMVLLKRRQTRKADKPFEPSIYEGLRLAAKEASSPKKEAKKIVLEPKLTPDQIKAREGSYFTDKDIETLIDEDADIYGLDADTGEKKLLAKFRKNVIPKDCVRQGWESFYQTSAPSRNRGAAAGPIDLKSEYWKKRKPIEITKWSTRYMHNGKLSKMRVNNLVFSSVLGFFERTPFMGLPCRLTSYTQRYFKQYKHGIPYIQQLGKVFKALVPDAYERQYKRASSKKAYQIPETPFSSVTINRNFRTALHMDDGDFKEGFGNLSVIERGYYHGGVTMFPRYKVGFDLRTGDFVAMDVHEWHCNTEMYETAEDKAKNKKLPRIHTDDISTGTVGAEKAFTRISFVCYLREKLLHCNEKDTQKYYDKIEFHPEKGSLVVKKGTRKIKT